MTLTLKRALFALARIRLTFSHEEVVAGVLVTVTTVGLLSVIATLTMLMRSPLLNFHGVSGKADKRRAELRGGGWKVARENVRDEE